MTDRELLDLAIAARERSYSPYSGFQVGAALLGERGEVYLGCNIENASFTPTVCAERVAIFQAVSHGETKFQKIAIVGGKKGERLNPICPPCGVCRQVMSEFCPPDFPIILGDHTHLEVHTLREVLPLSFGTEDMT